MNAVALYCPWEGDHEAAIAELLSAILGPVINVSLLI
jgi:hypothetical protein